MKESHIASLKDFAANAKGQSGSTGPQAWLETIPEWEAIKDAWLGTDGDPVPLSVIVKWLVQECGYSPKVATIGRVSVLKVRYPR